jgi:hypothetical protein
MFDSARGSRKWWAAAIVVSDELSGVKQSGYASTLKIISCDDIAGGAHLSRIGCLDR